jgi:hypothetical protein
MAYFDNPEKAARWERELAQLRAEKERRQASLPVVGRNIGISLAPPAIETRAAFGMARIAEPKTWSPPVRLPAQLPVSPQPAAKAPARLSHGEPITFEQLLAELGAPPETPNGELVFTPEPAPQPAGHSKPEIPPAKTVKFSLAPVPITFAELMAEAGLPAPEEKPARPAPAKSLSRAFAITPPKPKAEPAGMPLKPVPELITFSQLQAEAAHKQAI